MSVLDKNYVVTMKKPPEGFCVIAAILAPIAMIAHLIALLSGDIDWAILFFVQSFWCQWVSSLGQNERAGK